MVKYKNKLYLMVLLPFLAKSVVTEQIGVISGYIVHQIHDPQYNQICVTGTPVPPGSSFPDGEAQEESTLRHTLMDYIYKRKKNKGRLVKRGDHVTTCVSTITGKPCILVKNEDTDDWVTRIIKLPDDPTQKENRVQYLQKVITLPNIGRQLLDQLFLWPLDNFPKLEAALVKERPFECPAGYSIKHDKEWETLILERDPFRMKISKPDSPETTEISEYPICTDSHDFLELFFSGHSPLKRGKSLRIGDSFCWFDEVELPEIRLDQVRAEFIMNGTRKLQISDGITTLTIDFEGFDQLHGIDLEGKLEELKESDIFPDLLNEHSWEKLYELIDAVTEG